MTMKAQAVLATMLLVATTGCRFEQHKSGNDHTDNVKFATPFGGMSVKTDEKSAQAGVGLTPYPGAMLNRKDDGGKEDGAADVNFSFGNFHLGVKALSYQSADAPDKVLAFYRKDMAKFGAVILCHGRVPVGQPTRTADGLACDTDNSKTVHVSDSYGEDELKAGSKQHQHIVSVDAKNGGSKIGLVALDLPGNLSGEDDKE